MAERGKGSAVSDMAADLANQGTAAALTGSAAENSAGEPLGDLFRALDDEVAGHAGATIAPPKTRGPGRPAGSPNRTTLQLQRYLQARGYRDPAEFLASLVSMDTRELAAQLAGRGAVAAGVGFDDALEALELQRKAASELMPYFHSRMPLAVHHTGEGARPLIIINDAPVDGARVASRGDVMSVADIVENQQLSDGAADKSHDARSHDDD